MESGYNRNVPVTEERVGLIIKPMSNDVRILPLPLCTCAHQHCSFSCSFLHEDLIQVLPALPGVPLEEATDRGGITVMMPELQKLISLFRWVTVYCMPVRLFFGLVKDAGLIPILGYYT